MQECSCCKKEMELIEKTEDWESYECKNCRNAFLRINSTRDYPIGYISPTNKLNSKQNDK